MTRRKLPAPLEPSIHEESREVRAALMSGHDDASSDAITWHASVVQGMSAIWGPQTAVVLREIWATAHA
jgi:hypothetical protein